MAPKLILKAGAQKLGIEARNQLHNEEIIARKRTDIVARSFISKVNRKKNNAMGKRRVSRFSDLGYTSEQRCCGSSN